MSAWTAAFTAQAVGAPVTAVVALLHGGTPTRTDLAWAVVAGLGNGVGTATLYRGLASGRMGVVAPISGVGAAVVPVVVGIALGEQPGTLAWMGIAIALPAIWLVSHSAGAGPDTGRSGYGEGVVAGLGFGVTFVGLSQVGPDAGLLPLAANQVIAGVLVVIVATLLHEPWLPRSPQAAFGAVGGLLGSVATGLFLIASRGGNLSVTAVTVSFYPAFTVLLAAAVLRERIHRAQGLGLALCGLAVVLVAAA